MAKSFFRGHEYSQYLEGAPSQPPTQLSSQPPSQPPSQPSQHSQVPSLRTLPSLGGGRPFKEDIFYGCKCPCIEHSKFEECSCPTCTLARETVRAWDRQRALWYKERDAPSGQCACGQCCKDSAYRTASRSFASLRSFIQPPLPPKTSPPPSPTPSIFP